MNQWVNAFKAPFASATATYADNEKPTPAQVAVVWGLIGVLVARAL